MDARVKTVLATQLLQLQKSFEDQLPPSGQCLQVADCEQRLAQGHAAERDCDKVRTWLAVYCPTVPACPRCDPQCRSCRDFDSRERQADVLCDRSQEKRSCQDLRQQLMALEKKALPHVLCVGCIPRLLGPCVVFAQVSDLGSEQQAGGLQRFELKSSFADLTGLDQRSVHNSSAEPCGWNRGRKLPCNGVSM